MNYKVAKTMLILCIVYLVGFYILKFAFPELLIQAITSPTLLRLGEFMNSWKGFELIFMTLSTFITFYLFACASSGKFKFKLWQFGVIAGASIINTVFILFVPSLYTHTSISLMLIIAVVCKGKLLSTTISFTIHGYLSQFLLSIRGFETVIVYMNSLSGFMIGLEVYVWLILLAIIFNIKERKRNERMGTPLCKQAR